MKMTKLAVAFIAMAIIGGGIFGYAAWQTIQNFPAVGSSGSVVVADCSTLVNASLPAVGSNGTLEFGCGTNGASAAFSDSTGQSVTPTFTLTTPYSTLAVSTSPSCSSSTTLTSGSGVTLSKGSYYYCVSYTIWPDGGATAFSITWT